MNKIINIITKLNILQDSKLIKFNELVKEGYTELIRLKNNNAIDFSKLENSFYAAIDDTPQLHFLINNPTIENKKFIIDYIKKFQIKIRDNKYFLSPIQKTVFDLMKGNERYIFSLPTSSGKSFLIRRLTEYNLSKNKRTIIIAPTISLMNEYHQEFLKENMSSATNSYSNLEIFILTQERALNFEFKTTDVLLIDEAYVLGEKNDRAGIMYHVIYRAFKLKVVSHLFMPNIENPEDVIDNKTFTNYYEIYKNFKSLSTRNHKIINSSREDWFTKNLSCKLSIAIFDINKCFYKWYERFSNSFSINKFTPPFSKLINFLEIEFGENFSPLKLLKKGVVISMGDIPKIFRYFSELFFKQKEVNWILANSTLTKGVNIKPDNIVIFSSDFFLGRKINIFELRNAIGRSGRYDTKIEKRIGKVELVGEASVLSRFKEYEDEYTSNSIKEIIYANPTVIDVVDKFDFNGKNIDWVSGKFGMPLKKIQEWIKNNEKNLSEYILFKYKTKHNDKMKNNFDHIWDYFKSNDKLLEKFYEIGKDIAKIYYKKIEDFSKKQKDFLVNTLKYQGFRETLRIQKTFIQSANSELIFLQNREEKVYTDGKNISLVNKEKYFKVDKNISEKNKSLVLDFLIFRKTRIWTRFVEGFLNPLDSIIANTLDIKINSFDEIDLEIQNIGLPWEIKGYLISKIDLSKDICNQTKNILKTDSHMINIKKIISGM